MKKIKEYAIYDSYYNFKIFEGQYLNGKRWNGKGYNDKGNIVYELIDGKRKMK